MGNGGVEKAWKLQASVWGGEKRWAINYVRRSHFEARKRDNRGPVMDSLEARRGFGGMHRGLDVRFAALSFAFQNGSYGANPRLHLVP